MARLHPCDNDYLIFTAKDAKPRKEHRKHDGHEIHETHEKDLCLHPLAFVGFVDFVAILGFPSRAFASFAVKVDRLGESVQPGIVVVI
ncbi:MAG: hypothetical protein ACOY5W_11570 [Pseudomonadota bacterium]